MQPITTMESFMDAESGLAEAALSAMHTKEPLDAARSAPSKIHHLTLYGRADKRSLAAFAAAKVWFESAVRARRRKADRRASRSGRKAGSVRNYVVRFMTGSRAAASASMGRFNSVPPLPGSEFCRERQTGERAGIEGAQSRFAISVTLGPKRAGDMPGSIGRERFPGHGTYFTAVNASIVYCVRTSGDEPTRAL